MTGALHGRTNQTFPAKWLSLASPLDGARPNLAGELVEAAVAAQTVLDISSNPAVWGGHMRGTDATLMALGATDLERAQDEQHAHDLVQANLIEILCAIGREHLDFYFLRLRQPLQEFQISGALIALESCRQEGNVRFAGVSADNVAASLSVLQFHDAFEAVLLHEGNSNAPLKALAKSRRMSIISRSDNLDFEPESGQAALIRVTHPQDVQSVLQIKAAAR